MKPSKKNPSNGDKEKEMNPSDQRKAVLNTIKAIDREIRSIKNANQGKMDYSEDKPYLDLLKRREMYAKELERLKGLKD